MQAEFLLQREFNNKLEYGRGATPTYRLNFHSQLEIYVIHSGEVEILINDQRKILRGGEISMALSYDAHGYRTLKAGEAERLIIPLSYCSELLPLLPKHLTSPFINDPDTYARVSEALTHFAACRSEIARRGYVYVVLGILLEQLTAEEKADAKDPLFSSEILIYISHHFREELTLDSLAHTFGYNTSYLSRSFRRAFGISFGKYLTMLRLRETVLLMRAGKMSITACALESGFGSMRSFYRAFREEFGCTPKEYFASTPQSGIPTA